MEPVTLTRNERGVLAQLQEVYNGDFGFADEVSWGAAGLNSKASLSGVMSSLNKKGLIYSFEFEPKKKETAFEFTGLGLRVLDSPSFSLGVALDAKEAN